MSVLILQPLLPGQIDGQKYFWKSCLLDSLLLSTRPSSSIACAPALRDVRTGVRGRVCKCAVIFLCVLLLVSRWSLLTKTPSPLAKTVSPISYQGLDRAALLSPPTPACCHRVALLATSDPRSSSALRCGVLHLESSDWSRRAP